MLDKLNFSRGCAFVIGTGRSGTHWLGHTLEHHPEIRETIEVKPIFKWVKQIATNPSNKAELMPKLIKAYKKQMVCSPKKIYLDKSHPNIWLVEDLLQAFPEAQFLGIIRNPFATISSMIEHKRVSRWHKEWKDLPIPNQFLGITEEIAPTYDELSLAEQCAIRWKSHYERMQEVQRKFPKNSLIMHYESLAHNTSKELQRIEKFLGLKQPITAPEIRTESLEKWKAGLSEADIESIEAVVGMSYDAYLGLAI
jgi:hypothetical protein